MSLSARVFEDIAGVVPQAFARALVSEREDVGADRYVVVVVEDAIGAAADQLGRAVIAELLDQCRQELRQSPLMRGAIGLDLVDVVTQEVRCPFGDEVADLPYLLDRLARGVGDVSVIDAGGDVGADVATAHGYGPVGV